MSSKAQSSLEFVILFAALVFFAFLFIFALEDQLSDKNVQQISLLTRETALIIKDEINLASEATDGFSRQFTLPNKLLNEKYNITIVEDFVYVTTLNMKHSVAYPIINVTGQPVVGINTIKKVDGRIYLNSQPV